MSDEGYYLIHLGRDIVTCPGDRTTALEHLSKIRNDVIIEHRQATGHDPDVLPWLIGHYPPHSVGGPSGKGGVFSYGYAPTLRGRIDIPRSEWEII